MTTKPTKKPYRKRHLFARSIDNVVKEATKPLMDKQGKIYGALLRDWAQIVGNERASVTRPERLQFPTQTEAGGATLHLAARPSAAPELAYMLEPMLEQCARYFGYRAIARIVIHATHSGFTDAEEIPSRAFHQPVVTPAPLSPQIPPEMREVFARISRHVASTSDKKN